MSSQLDIMLELDRSEPCSWCGAQPTNPCRADRGRGSELTRSVHPVRRKQTPDTDEVGVGAVLERRDA